MRVFIVSLAAVMASTALLLGGYGLLTLLAPVRATALGWSDGVIGLLGSMHYAGFILGCLFGPRLILTAGHIRTFTAVLALMTIAVLILPILPEIVFWAGARFVIGAGMAGVYLVVESWLNERAEPSVRGAVISAYVTLSFLSITAGQFLSPFAGAADGPDAGLGFSMIAILFAAAAVPVALTRSEQPAPIAVPRFEPMRLYRLSPVGLTGVMLNGVIMGTFFSLAPAYALDRGIDGAALPAFTGLGMLAGAAMQVPLGRLSDRVDRRFVLLGLCAATLVVCLALSIATREAIGFYGLFALSVLFGAAAMPIYAIAAAHAFDYAEPERYVQVSAGLLMANGVGACIAPLIAGAGMDALGAGAAFGVPGAAALLFIGFTGLRITRREAMETGDKDDFSIAVSAPVGAVAPPDPIEENRIVTAPESVGPGVLEAWLGRADGGGNDPGDDPGDDRSDAPR